MLVPRKTLIILILLVLPVMVSCGQKGDLYHPEDEQSALPYEGTRA